LEIKKFFILSLAVHVVIFACIYYVGIRTEVKKPKTYTANLISPEELPRPQAKPIPPPPKMRPLQPAPRKARPAPPLARIPEKIPLPPRLPMRPKPVPRLDTPDVPGEGKETGKPLPEGLRPEEDEAAKSAGRRGRGDASDTSNAVEQGKPGFSVRGSLEDIAKAEVKKDSGRPGSKPKRDDAITFNTDDFRFRGYMKLLKNKIESIWVYPPDEAAKGHYGDLRIKFTIKKDGRLGEVRRLNTSGYPSLDEAAVKALKEGEPYWPLPDDWGMDEYTIEGHFIYSIYGYQQIQ